jgi:hypothetical protein
MTPAATYAPWSYGSGTRDRVGVLRWRSPTVGRAGSLFGRQAEFAAVEAGAGSLVFVEGPVSLSIPSVNTLARAPPDACASSTGPVSSATAAASPLIFPAAKR